MTTRTRMATVAALLLTAGVHAEAQAPADVDRIASALRSVARDPLVVAGAGLTSSDRRLWALESAAPGDARPKVVLIGGLDGSAASADEVIRVIRWWVEDPSAAGLRSAWQVVALPCARPESCTEPGARASEPPWTFPPAGGFFDGKADPAPQHVWRWVTMQAPTVVIEIASGAGAAWEPNALAGRLAPGAPAAAVGSLTAALAAAGTGAAWSRPVPALHLSSSDNGAAPAIAALLARTDGIASPLADAIAARQQRAPFDVARLLAPKYPAQAIMSYIPALAWSGALRLARLTGEPRFREKPLADLAPFLSGEKPTIAEPYLLTSLAGHLALSDLGEFDGNASAAALARKGADFILPQSPGEIVRFPRAWTDDMFMATSVLARVGARTGDARYGATAGRLLTSYATDLQRPDGVFIHAKEGPFAWGRGNGFAAFGLMEGLTWMPASWPDRPRVLDAYRAHMRALVAHQAPDGMWRQVVDEPGSYRELTVTAMVLTAMARGVRLGWLDGSFRPVVDRAWHGLLARIAEDGTLIDVCTGTGSGPTKQYYLNRAGITGADDRGGAMALTAALEMAELAGAGTRP